MEIGREIGSESLLHRKIWRTNPLLGYMHTSFALGWFLLILTGWIETLVYFKGHNVPLYVDIFFSYYVHPIFERNFNFSLIKDALLLLILIGIGLALFKRIRSRAMGMRRTTKHVLGDRIALTALWFIFPARLLAESFTSGVLWKFGGIGWALGDQVHIIPPGIGGGSFLTNTTGELLANTLPNSLLIHGRTSDVVVLFHFARRLFLRVAVLALHAHLYRNSADIPAQCRYPQRRSREKLRPFPDRSVLTVRDMHRSVPAPKRCRDRQRSVGLFLAQTAATDT